MIRVLLIMVMLLFTSCASPSIIRLTPKQKGVDYRLIPYVVEYKYLIDTDKYEDRFNNLSLNFVPELKGSTIGRCWWLLNDRYEIEIDKKWWDSKWTSFLDKQFVVWHELEHCIRFRMHTNRVKKIYDIEDLLDEIGYLLGIIPKPGYFKDGCPVSIMNSHSMSHKCQSDHYQDYIRDIMLY